MLLQPLERVEPPAKGADVMGEEWAPAYERSWPILIVCPPTLINNWHRELSEWGRFRWGAGGGRGAHAPLLVASFLARCFMLKALAPTGAGRRHALTTPTAALAVPLCRIALCTSGRIDSAVTAVMMGKAEIMLIGYEML